MTKIAGIQFAAKEDPETSLGKALELAALAVERGAGLIAFPELCTTRWFPNRMRQGNFELAEAVPGPATERLCLFAAQNDVVIVYPFFEMAGKGRYFNSTAVIDAGGKLLGIYRKIHIPNVTGWQEKFYFLPGDKGFPVFDTRIGRVGVQISWDIFFPEGSRILALKGAQLIVVPTANAHASHDRWERMMAGNALANGLFFLRVNRVGREEKQTFYGKSFCMNPHGELVHKPAGARDSVHISTIDLDEIPRTRQEWAFFRDRREDQYVEIRGRLLSADGLGIPPGLYSGGADDE
ncbi:MAG: acyltransferase [bacterium]|nr:acyltransferase [bacterium]MDT8395852.1 nitrilase-related carbon-nitrogen hydrolase [bacterium]